MTDRLPPYTTSPVDMSASPTLGIRPPFTMEETTHAPVHLSACDVCKDYILHVAEGSRNFALERYYAQKAEALHTSEMSRRQHERTQQELSAARLEIQRLQKDLDEAKSTRLSSQMQRLNLWESHYLDYGSEVYCTSFAATAWAYELHGDGARLYINQHNNLIELALSGQAADLTAPPASSTNIVYGLHKFEAAKLDELNFDIGDRVEIIEKDELYGDGWWKGRTQDGRVGIFPGSYTCPNLPPHLARSTQNQASIWQWDRSFVFPGGLMPDSAITAANSKFRRSLIPDGEHRGRSIIRVFYFDSDGTLREWLHQAPQGWRRTTFQVKGADPRCISATCWAEDGYAHWSVFFMSKEETVNGEWRPRRLLERRCTGSMGAQWSKTVDIGWSWSRQEGDGPLQSCFSAITNTDGSDRQIFCLDPSSPKINSKFQTLKWGGPNQNKWLMLNWHAKNGFPQWPSNAPPSSYAALYVPGSWGTRIYFEEGDGIAEWMQMKGYNDGSWLKSSIGFKNSSPRALVAAAVQMRTGQLRQFVFSVVTGRIVQTTYNSEANGWTTKPIVIRNL